MNLTLFLNHRCNLRCTYCYTGRKFHRPMTLDIAKKGVDFGLDMADQGFLILSFFGGEPFLETELMEKALEYALHQTKQRGIHLFPTIATNGTLLGNRRLTLLMKYGFQVQVSLDGCQAAHDETRRFRNGRSSYARIESNLKQILAAGLKVRVVAVVDPSNAKYMGRSFDHLMDLGVKRIYFAPNYTGPWDNAACEIFETSLRDLGDRYMARFEVGQDVRLDPLNGKVVTHLAQGYKEKNLCQFGQKELSISPLGNIYPCDRLVGEDNNPDICIGNLEGGLNTKRRDQMVQAKNTPDSECKECALQPRCAYWCGCANYETTGNVGQVSPIVCWFERCFIAEADRVANAMYSTKNPIFLRRFYVPEAKI
ncbi:MAG: radical SAM protein [Pseudomonadota bacterium]